jgi:hypothetical protein
VPKVLQGDDAHDSITFSAIHKCFGGCMQLLQLCLKLLDFFRLLLEPLDGHKRTNIFDGKTRLSKRILYRFRLHK